MRIPIKRDNETLLDNIKLTVLKIFQFVPHDFSTSHSGLQGQSNWHGQFSTH